MVIGFCSFWNQRIVTTVNTEASNNEGLLSYWMNLCFQIPTIESKLILILNKTKAEKANKSKVRGWMVDWIKVEQNTVNGGHFKHIISICICPPFWYLWLFCLNKNWTDFLLFWQICDWFDKKRLIKFLLNIPVPLAKYFLILKLD